MSRPSFLNKVILFGLLGGVGCLVGAGAGEAWIAASDAWRPPVPAGQREEVITRPPEVTAPKSAEVRAAPSAPELPPALPAETKKVAADFPPEIRATLASHGAHVGEIEVCLKWYDLTDLDLHVVTPNGVEICFTNKKPAGGGELDVDMNVTPQTRTPVEHVYFHKGEVLNGRYRVFVVKYTDHEDGSPTRFEVYVKQGSGEIATYKDLRVANVKESKPVCEFEVPPRELKASPSKLVIVDQDGTNRLSVRVSRGGFEGPVQLTLSGDLDGLTARPGEVAAGSDLGFIEIAAAAFANEGSRAVKVRASGGGVHTDDLPATVNVRALPDSFRISAYGAVEVPQGHSNTLPLTLYRDHFRGPVVVRCEGDTEGVDAPAVTFEAGVAKQGFVFHASEDAPQTERDLKLIGVGGSTEFELPVNLKVTPGVVQAQRFWTWFGVGQTAVWTALISLGLTVLLTAWQARALGRSVMSGRVVLGAFGGLLAGAAAGGCAEVLHGVLGAQASAPVAWGVFVACWAVLGGMLGRGIAFFVPNLKAWKATAAGGVGGALGSLAFLAAGQYGPAFSRFAGAAILGLCIGAMVALVEVLFRSYWLEIAFPEGFTRSISLGDTPVSIGSDARSTLYVAGAAPLAWTYSIRDKRVTITEGATGATHDATVGDTRTAGDVSIVVQGSDADAPATAQVLPAPMPDPDPSPPVRPSPVKREPPAPVTTPRVPPEPVAIKPPPLPTPPVKPQVAPGPKVASACPGCGTPLPRGARSCIVCGEEVFPA
jgi:hypothetical protein